MELAGDEKRIQALFSELRFEDQRSSPRFEKVWNCAGITTRAHGPVFNRSLIMFASVLILVAIGAFAWFSRDLSIPSSVRGEAKIQPQVLATVYESPAKQPKKTTALGSRRVVHRRVARQHTIERAVVQNAVVLSTWRSPTGALMESPAASVLKTLPALNESANDLESYLSTNELKESKQ